MVIVLDNIDQFTNIQIYGYLKFETLLPKLNRQQLQNIKIVTILVKGDHKVAKNANEGVKLLNNVTIELFIHHVFLFYELLNWEFSSGVEGVSGGRYLGK